MSKAEKSPAKGRIGAKKGNTGSLTNIEKHNQRISAEERRKNAHKAAEKSAAVRKHHKSIKEALLTLLAMPSEARPDISNYEALALSMIEAAQGGNVSAATWVRDSAGEKPVDRSETDVKNSDGSLSRAAVIDLTGWTPEQIASACDAAFAE